MMNLVTVPDNRLRIKTKPVKKVTPLLRKIFKEMVSLTQTFVDPEGVGLASTQIGEKDQYFIAKMDDGSFCSFINPKILKASPKTKFYLEGCLSIPDVYGEVERHVWVDVEYLDESGKKISERLKGLVAWIFQHEIDHLNGKLFVDRVVAAKGKLLQVTGRDVTGEEVFEEIKLS